jgi:hypothetical protein
MILTSLLLLLCDGTTLHSQHSRKLLFKRLGNDKVVNLVDAAETPPAATASSPVVSGSAAAGDAKWDRPLYVMPTNVKESPKRDYSKAGCEKKGWGWEPLIDNMQIWQGAEKKKPMIRCMVSRKYNKRRATHTHTRRGRGHTHTHREREREREKHTERRERINCKLLIISCFRFIP